MKILDHGPVFIKVELIFTLEGTYHSSVVMKMYRHLPKIEFSYRVYRTKDQTILVNTFDTPLLYMGEMESHPILLCDNKEENNKRPVYSWIMNNTWETNFKMDLSGFSEFRYGVEIVEQGTAEKDMESLSDNDKGVVTFICG